MAVQARVPRLDRVRERAGERRREQALAELGFAACRALERRGDGVQKLGVRERLRHESGRASRERLAERVVGACAGDDHDGKAGPALAHGRQQLESGQAGHDHVADDERELGRLEH